MRIRSIKPEFWRSEDITELSWDVRLLFIGLWSYVDDNGVGKDNERAITADLFALEDDPRDTLATVSRGLATLATAGLITRYTADGRNLLHITTWERHQKIDRPGKPRFALPTSTNAVPRDTLATPSRESRDGLDAGTGEQGTGEQGAGTSGATAPEPPSPAKRRTAEPRGSRLPEDFPVTDDMRTWAGEHAPQAGQRDHDAFCDYWRDQPGAKGRKVDWIGTWRNWMRRASDDRTPRAGKPVSRAEAEQAHHDGIFDRAMQRAVAADAAEAAAPTEAELLANLSRPRAIAGSTW